MIQVEADKAEKETARKSAAFADATVEYERVRDRLNELEEKAFTTDLTEDEQVEMTTLDA